MSTKHLISTGASLAIVLVLAGAGCSGTYNMQGSTNTDTEQMETESSGNMEMKSNTDASMEAGSMMNSSSDVRVEVLGEDDTMEKDENDSMKSDADGSVTVEADGELIVQPVKTFDMTARQWEFSPETITVNEGDRVVLNIESQDVTHGFAIPQFGVNKQLEPGQTTRVEFVADKAGTYTFFCSVFCGSGHPNMQGTLIVN